MPNMIPLGELMTCQRTTYGAADTILDSVAGVLLALPQMTLSELDARYMQAEGLASVICLDLFAIKQGMRPPLLEGRHISILEDVHVLPA